MRMTTNNVYMSTPPMTPLSCFSLRTTAGVLLVAALVTQAQAQEAVSLPSVTVQSSPSGADMPARNRGGNGEHAGHGSRPIPQ